MSQIFGAFFVTVNLDWRLTDMIRAAKVQYKEEAITPANFPIVEKGIHMRELKILRIDRKMTGNDVVYLMQESRVRPATLPELLAFVQNHRGEGTYAAFGSMSMGGKGRQICCVYDVAGEHYLALSRMDEEYDVHWRFLVVSL